MSALPEPQSPLPEDTPIELCEVARAGLTLRYRLIGDRQKPLVVLQHGAKDHGQSWDFVVAALLDDYCFAVPDLRGHGDSDHALGGGYGDIEYVTDMAALLDDLTERGFASPFTLVGHSLGGNICLHYTAAFPDTVARLVCIEGIGTPPSRYEEIMAAPPQERWSSAVRKRLSADARGGKRFASYNQALSRMMSLHTRIDPPVVEYITATGLKEQDGALVWKYDPALVYAAHRPEAPAEYGALYQGITCPVLLFYGTESFATSPHLDGRMDDFAKADLRLYDGAGHWLHHDQPERFIPELATFLAES